LENGDVEAHFNLYIVDGEKKERPRRHVGVFNPGVDADQFIAAVNKSLVDDLGYPAMDESCHDRIKRVMALEHTPEVIAAFNQQK
jgi:hypothetical protein